MRSGCVSRSRMRWTGSLYVLRRSFRNMTALKRQQEKKRHSKS